MHDHSSGAHGTVIVKKFSRRLWGVKILDGYLGHYVYLLALLLSAGESAFSHLSSGCVVWCGSQRRLPSLGEVEGSIVRTLLKTWLEM